MKITRRGFISMLAIAGTGAVLVPNRKIFLPPRHAMSSMAGDFDIANLRYKSTERFSDMATDWRAIYGSSPELSQASLERTMDDLVKHGRSIVAVNVNRLVVHPDKVEAAEAAFPGQVETRYFVSPSTWYLKTDVQDMKMASLLERHALANGIRVRRAG